MHEQDRAILKSLVSVAWADGRVSDEETEILEALLQSFRSKLGRSRRDPRVRQDAAHAR